MNRRRFLRGSTALLAAGVLAGCVKTTNSDGTTTVTVTLAGAQAEATAILTALQAQAALVGSSLSTAASTALSATETAVANFIGIPADATPADYASAVVKTVTGVLALLSLPTATATAITLGISLISGLVTGVATVSVPASSVEPTALAYGGPSKAVAPIIIPIPGA